MSYVEFTLSFLNHTKNAKLLLLAPIVEKISRFRKQGFFAVVLLSGIVMESGTNINKKT